MRGHVYWVPGPWPGRLAVMPRPRGGDWLDDDVRAWRRAGVDVVVSLLTPDEVADLDLADEEALSRATGIELVGFPVIDRGVPASRAGFAGLVTHLADRLGEGKTVAVHCRQGIGRAGLVAIGLLAAAGVDRETAMQQVGSARGCVVPETSEQREWIADFARSFGTVAANR